MEDAEVSEKTRVGSGNEKTKPESRIEKWGVEDVRAAHGHINRQMEEEERKGLAILYERVDEANLESLISGCVDAEKARLMGPAYVNKIVSETMGIIDRSKAIVGGEVGCAPGDVGVNMVTVLNIESVVEAEQKLPWPVLTPQRRWNRLAYSSYANKENLDFELSGVSMESFAGANELKKRLVEYGVTVNPLTGGKLIEDVEMLLKEDWKCISTVTPEGDRVDMYFPGRMPVYDEYMELGSAGVVGVLRDMQTHLGPGNRDKAVLKMLMFPSSREVPRSFCDDNVVVMDSGNLRSGEIAAHEWVHGELNLRYGACRVGALAEGMAVYFAHQQFLAGPLNTPENQYRARDVVEKVCEAAEVGKPVVTTVGEVARMVDANVGENTVYEYNYPYGEMLVSYIMEKYGRENLMQIYEYLSKKNENLYDMHDGKQMIKDGEVVVPEAELLRKGITAVVGNLAEFENGLAAFLNRRRSVSMVK